MLANTQLAGLDVAAPDQCWTPAPPGPPQIVPYVNQARAPVAQGFCPKVTLVGGKAHTLSTTIPLSSGDEAGIAGGVKSHTFIGPSRHTTSSAKVLWGGSPATGSTAKSSQNSNNADGKRVVPSQPKVRLNA